MDFNAKLVQINEPITGEGKNGTWKRQDLIFETESQYPRKICVSVWGDRAINNPADIVIGNRLNVSFEIESREYQGRWYTDVRAWRIQPVANAMAAAPAPAQEAPAAPYFPPSTAQEEEKDDLPF